jgi:DNA-binding transcriptional regulator YiaG
MRKTDIIVRLHRDGTLHRVLPDGTEVPMPDPGPLAPMTPEEVEAAARRDPDARPMTEEEFRRARRVPRTKTLRRALGLTQQEFAARYGIPLGTLRDWEQGRTEPDQPARAYLEVIARNPEGARHATDERAAPWDERRDHSFRDPKTRPGKDARSGPMVDGRGRGRDLFIVDNSVSGWTGLRYLHEWAEIAKAFDIATGFFEIGALLALEGRWQSLEKIRILMGSERTHRTRRALLEAVLDRAVEVLDTGLEGDKDANPFLNSVPAILEALRSKQIECRVYDRDKFHAKAYITHAKIEVVGSQALVGSSNFTVPGLTKNIELNVQIQSAREVTQLQEWFEAHWKDAQEITDDIITTVSRHTHLYTPFDVYAKALQEFFRGHELTATEWDETRSKIFPVLDRYQKEAYWALLKIARQQGGAFLCDGVGLGKTFVGLMLIERFILHEGKRVVLFAPKPTKEGVWEPHLREWLPHIGGVGGGADFSNLAIFSHTDLGRKGDFPQRFQRIAELADVVLIDEAHHFRNPGRRTVDGRNEPSRYYRLFDLLDNAVRPKTVFLFTATPINNRLADFRHMAELFTRRDESYFARTLGINNLRAHFNNMERSLRDAVGHEIADVSGHMAEVQNFLASDEIFRQLVVQRSRSYARESQLRELGTAAAFPNRKPPQVAEYSIRKTYGRLLEIFEQAFAKTNPLFTLPMYYPLHWYRGLDKDIDPFEENRQKQVVGLIRTQFLKRFESSVASFELSCDRLLKKLLAFLEIHSQTDAEKRRLERWKSQNGEILGYAAQRQFDFWGEESEEEEDEDIVPQEMLDQVEHLKREDYDVAEMMSETLLDLDEIVKFLEEARKFDPKHDDKLQKLIRLLRSKELTDQKVLIFTEFADTARYLKRQLDNAGIDGVSQVDSATKTNRAEIIKRFSPYYNGTNSGELAKRGREEIRILISTDVLSEGLNLQDASRVINYDIHWNPVRLMQRIGRVDRRMNPEIEARLVADHPDVRASRGTVSFWNFLPPDELNAILSLYRKVTQKTLLISKTLGIEGKKLLTPEDDYEALREFNHSYEGTRTAIEDMHLEYQALLQADPRLEARLKRLPGSTFSGRKRPARGTRGVFFCYALPALDKEAGEFTEEAGTTRWYLYDADRDSIFEDPAEIVSSIRSKPDTPRKCTTEETTLIELRKKVQRHITNTYLKRIDAPVGVKPVLKCWMELNEG